MSGMQQHVINNVNLNTDLLQYKKVILTAANIRALETTAINLVSAVAGKMVLLEQALLVYNVGATASFDDAAADGDLQILYTTSGTVASLTLDADGFLDNASDQARSIKPLATDIDVVNGEGLEIKNDGNAYTGATADGVVDVHIWYRIISSNL